MERQITGKKSAPAITMGTLQTGLDLVLVLYRKRVSKKNEDGARRSARFR